MESTIKLTETQKKALELIKRLSDEGKIGLSEAVQLIIAIYENQKEIEYIPYQSPYVGPWTTGPDNTPWWEQNKIMCNGSNTNSTQGRPDLFTYAISGSKRDPFDWTINSWIG